MLPPLEKSNARLFNHVSVATRCYIQVLVLVFPPESHIGHIPVLNSSLPVYGRILRVKVDVS